MTPVVMTRYVTLHLWTWEGGPIKATSTTTAATPSVGASTRCICFMNARFEVLRINSKYFKVLRVCADCRLGTHLPGAVVEQKFGSLTLRRRLLVALCATRIVFRTEDAVGI